MSIKKIGMEQKNFPCTAPLLKKGKGRCYFEVYYALPSGKRFRRKLYQRSDKIFLQREQHAAEWLAEYDPMDYPLVVKKKIHQAPKKLQAMPPRILQYLHEYRYDWKPKHYKNNLYLLGKFSQWWNAQALDCAIDKISIQSAKDFMRWIREQGASGKTQNHLRSTLRTLYKRWRVKSNPWDEVYRHPDNSVPQKAFAPDERKSLFEKIASEDAELKLFVEIIYFCFLRPNEIRFVKVKDIDFHEKLVTVYEMNSKTNRIRRHPIPTVFLEDLLFLKEYGPETYIFGSNGGPGKFHCGRDKWSRRSRRLMDKYGYGLEYSLYSWRHTGAIEMYKETRDVRMVQMAMQHTSIETTTKYLRNFGVMYDQRLFERKSISS